MKLEWKNFAAPLLCLAVAGLPQMASAADAVVATVNGHEIHQSDVDGYIQDFHLNPQQAARKDQIINELVSRELVYQDAMSKGLDKRADVIAELDQLKVKVLLNAAVREAMEANPITDDEMKAEYQKQLPRMQQKQYHARHILVKSEDEAKAIIASLNKGGDFAKLAKEKSTDPSKNNGGDLGWFQADQMVKPFADTVRGMNKGTYTKTPVQTEFGWHVIKLEDVRDGKAPDFNQVKPQLQGFLQQRHIAAYLEKLRADAKVDVKESPTPMPTATDAKKQ